LPEVVDGVGDGVGQPISLALVQDLLRGQYVVGGHVEGPTQGNEVVDAHLLRVAVAAALLDPVEDGG
jgi:hypothetical protein